MLTFVMRMTSFFLYLFEKIEAVWWYRIIDNFGVLCYMTMISVLTVSWFEAYQKLKIYVKLAKSKSIFNMRITFIILIPLQYTAYLLYIFYKFGQNYYLYQFGTIIITIVPAPIILAYYGHKLIKIIESFIKITGQKTDLIRLRNFKLLRTVLVSLALYRVILWNFVIIKYNILLDWDLLYDDYADRCLDLYSNCEFCFIIILWDLAYYLVSELIPVLIIIKLIKPFKQKNRVQRVNTLNSCISKPNLNTWIQSSSKEGTST